MNRVENSNSALPSLPLRLWRHLRLGDYFVAVAFLALALSSFWLGNLFSQNGRSARTARVFVRNLLVAEVDLRQSQSLRVAGALGPVTLTVSDYGIRAAASTCPNQFCVKQGLIRRPQQILVCVPNHLLVTIAGQQPTDVDAITH